MTGAAPGSSFSKSQIGGDPASRLDRNLGLRERHPMNSYLVGRPILFSRIQGARVYLSYLPLVSCRIDLFSLVFLGYK